MISRIDDYNFEDFCKFENYLRELLTNYIFVRIGDRRYFIVEDITIHKTIKTKK